MGGSVLHDKKGDRWYIQIYWEQKRYRIYRHPITHEPFHVKKSAEKLLDRIRSEIDYQEFNPKAYFPDNPLSIKEYAVNWLDTLDVSPNTYQSYSSAVKNFIVPFFQNKDLRRVRHSDLVAFLKWIPRAKKTKYNILATLRTMMRYAWRNEDLPKVPPFPTASYELPEIEYLTFEQQNQILDVIPKSDRPIFLFMQEYGVRPGEAQALKRDCLVDGEVHIRRTLSGGQLRETTKTGKTRRYPITEFFQEILSGMPPSINPYVFTRSDGKPYTNKNLNLIWRTACSQVGISIKMYNAFRHSLGCQLLDQGEDLDLVREQLGHTKAEMTRRYAKRSQSKLSDALDRRRKVVKLEKPNKRKSKA